MLTLFQLIRRLENEPETKAEHLSPQRWAGARLVLGKHIGSRMQPWRSVIISTFQVERAAWASPGQFSDLPKPKVDSGLGTELGKPEVCASITGGAPGGKAKEWGTAAGLSGGRRKGRGRRTWARRRAGRQTGRSPPPAPSQEPGTPPSPSRSRARRHLSGKEPAQPSWGRTCGQGPLGIWGLWRPALSHHAL